MKRLIAVLMPLVFLALPAVAEDDAATKRAKERQAKAAVEYFRKQWKTRNQGRKMNAILELSRVKHDLVIEELAKKGLRDNDSEVRDATAQMLGEMSFNAALAGEKLKTALPRNEDYPEVLRSLIRSIAKLKYMDAFEELKEAAKHLNDAKYQHVTVEVVRAFGTLKDARSLPFLLWMAEYGGHALRWSTGTVNVDTGAAGDVDQRAAEAAGHAKYGHVKPKKPPAPVIRTYMQELEKTVKTLTGQKFENATQFRKWLAEHAEELGLDPRKLSK